MGQQKALIISAFFHCHAPSHTLKYYSAYLLTPFTFSAVIKIKFYMSIITNELLKHFIVDIDESLFHNDCESEEAKIQNELQKKKPTTLDSNYSKKMM